MTIFFPNRIEFLLFAPCLGINGLIIDGSYMRVWIDHILYSGNTGGWVSDGKIWREMPGGERIYHKSPTGSDYFPVTYKITLE